MMQSEKIFLILFIAAGCFLFWFERGHHDRLGRFYEMGRRDPESCGRALINAMRDMPVHHPCKE